MITAWAQNGYLFQSFFINLYARSSSVVSSSSHSLIHACPDVVRNCAKRFPAIRNVFIHLSSQFALHTRSANPKNAVHAQYFVFHVDPSLLVFTLTCGLQVVASSHLVNFTREARGMKQSSVVSHSLFSHQWNAETIGAVMRVKSSDNRKPRPTSNSTRFIRTQISLVQCTSSKSQQR